MHAILYSLWTSIIAKLNCTVHFDNLGTCHAVMARCNDHQARTVIRPAVPVDDERTKLIFCTQPHATVSVGDAR